MRIFCDTCNTDVELRAIHKEESTRWNCPGCGEDYTYFTYLQEDDDEIEEDDDD